MLLNPKHRKAMGIVWGVIVVLIILSMIAISMPSLFS
jgi:hypothetical protein